MSDSNEDFTDKQSLDVPSFDIPRSAWTLFPTLGYSSITAWGRLLSGTVLSVGSMVAGAYVLRNVERPTSWAITSFSVGAAGVFLTGRSLRELWSTASQGFYNLAHDTAEVCEETYLEENSEIHPDAERLEVVLGELSDFSCQNFRNLPPVSSIYETSQDFQASLSDVSSDILNLNLDKYLPERTFVLPSF